MHHKIRNNTANISSDNKIIFFLGIATVFIAAIVTICGVCSFQMGHHYEIMNQYGETIKMWGAGIYANDSYFKASISIGSDFTILIFIVPLAFIYFLKMKANSTIENHIQALGIMSLLLYYSASIAFGVTYNRLHLLYIALFGMCFYCVFSLFAKLHAVQTSSSKVCEFPISNGIKIFLVASGVALFVAWLPDIITSIASDTSLDLIEVYTTEITYVIDMGIISPLMFLTLYLVNKRVFMGYVLLRMILKVCLGIGIMLPIQTAFQMLSGITIPIPALITKIMIFVMLGIFAAIFEHRLKQETNSVTKAKNL